MNVDLLIKENKELSEEKQRYKEMWFSANDSLSKYRELEEQIGCPLEVREKALIKDFIWYDDNGRLIQVIPMNSGYIMEKGKKIAVLNCIYNFNFWLAIKCKDYKKAWWLKKNREE